MRADIDGRIWAGSTSEVSIDVLERQEKVVVGKRQIPELLPASVRSGGVQCLILAMVSFSLENHNCTYKYTYTYKFYS